MSENFIYLDHAAATPVDDKVLAAMTPYFSDKFFNPSAPYFPAIEVKHDYEDAKSQLAQLIGAKSDELVMTAGATESVNLAFSAANSSQDDSEILVGKFEHHSVLAAAKKFGKLVKINIKESGLIDIEDLANKISPKTRIVSVMIANNETGVIQPITKIAELVRSERQRRLSIGDSNPIYLHSDASQGVGQLDIHVSRLGIDMITLNAGKIYGPKQIGLLWADRNVSLVAQVVGGGQERNLRSGTENVAAVIGFAKALQLTEKHRKNENQRLKDLKQSFKKTLRSNFTETEMIFLGDEKKQLNSHISLSFPGIDAERIVFSLETNGVLLSTGSACAANKASRSQTLCAMNLGEEVIDGSLRVSIGKLSNEDNMKQAAEIISQTVRDEINRIKGASA